MILNIEDAVYDRLWEYIRATDSEIGGFGWAFEDDGAWYWTHLELPEQEATPASIDYDDDALMQVLVNAEQHGVLDDPRFAWVVWHSHGHLSTYFSKTDIEESIELLGGIGQVKRLFNFVGNHDGNYKLRVDVWDCPIIGHAYSEDVYLARPSLRGLRAEVMKEVSEKVREPKREAKTTVVTRGKELVKPDEMDEYDVEDLMAADGGIHSEPLDEWPLYDQEGNATTAVAIVHEDGTVTVKEGNR